MRPSQSLNLRMTVFASLFTALIIIGGYIHFPIPLSPVPIVLSDFFVMLSGLFLGAAWGVSSVAMFLFLGGLGLPVFAGGKAGLAVFFGPTGGFLLGFLVGVALIGFISEKGKPSWWKDLVALVLGNVVIFALGVPWLKLMLKVSWDKALAIGLIPFLLGLVLKVIVAVVVIQTLRPLFRQATMNLSQSEGK